MKLQKKSGSVTSSGSEEKHSFGIGDVGIVIEILRNRLYSNPIQTLTQEYLSNGRDATREAGSKKALLVTLPTKIDSVMKIRDYGPGLSPERVKEVFVLYGASTKRDNNNQTGGFGIGAKSAWAYTDSFTVTSFYKGKARTYIAHTGENANGTFELVDEESTKEANGVEIQIPVKTEDIEKFKSAVFRSTFFWDVRPEFKGIVKQEIPEWYVKSEPIIKGTGWGVFDLPSSWGLATKDYGYDRDYLMGMFVVDGIPYDVPEVISDSEEFDDLSSSFRSGQVVIYFNTGEIEVSASREAVVLDKKNTALIYEKFEQVQKDVDASIEKELKTVKTVPEAISKFQDLQKIFSDYLVCKKTWKGKVDKKDVSVKFENEYSHSIKLEVKDLVSTYWEMSSTYKNKTLRTTSGPSKLNYLKLSSERMNTLYLLDEVCEKPEDVLKVQERIKKRLSADNVDLGVNKYLSLISGIDAAWAQKNLPNVVLSSTVQKVERKKVERKAKEEGSMNILQLHSGAMGFSKVNIKVDEFKKKNKVVYLELEDGSYWKGYTDNKYEILHWAHGAQMDGYTIVGLTAKQAETFKKPKEYSEFVKEMAKKVKVSKKIHTAMKWNALYDHDDDIGYAINDIKGMEKLATKLKNKELVKLIKVLKEIKVNNNHYRDEYLLKYTKAYSLVKKEVKEIADQVKSFEKKYPLLDAIDWGYLSPLQTTHLIKYMNSVS